MPVFAKEDRIKEFMVMACEARDQGGRLCPLVGCGAGFAMGGTRMWIGIKPDEALARQVTIKATLVLNDRTADLEVAVRRRTEQERGVNWDLEWTFLKEPHLLEFR